MNCRSCDGGLVLVKIKVDNTRYAFRCNCDLGNRYPQYPHYSYTYSGYEPWFTKEEISQGGVVRKEAPAANFLDSLDVRQEAEIIKKEMAQVIHFRPIDLPGEEDICPV